LVAPACDSEAEDTPPASPEQPKTAAGKMAKQGKDKAKAAGEALNKRADDILEQTANPQ
jgi:hypothetical protein